MEQRSVLFKSLLGHSYPEDINNVAAFGYAIIDTVSRYSQLVFYKVSTPDWWYINIMPRYWKSFSISTRHISTRHS